MKNQLISALSFEKKTITSFENSNDENSKNNKLGKSFPACTEYV
ncbi:hypothetical protein VB796_17985 [Arcicella sp. LKC2W]|nr:hypothetical protein [Arcicella sp. LKC2W]MEA5460956.1 hypothetical protein [Arcicella sp. LKC2W]